MATAEKIRASGFPKSAFSALDEPLLTAILEGMAEESDPSLHEAWENLLANVATEGNSPTVRRAFPRILRELEPADAQLLNEIWDSVTKRRRLSRGHSKLDDASLGNLERLGLVSVSEAPPIPMVELLLTALGAAFVRACRAPKRYA